MNTPETVMNSQDPTPESLVAKALAGNVSEQSRLALIQLQQKIQGLPTYRPDSSELQVLYGAGLSSDEVNVAFNLHGVVPEANPENPDHMA